MDMISEPKVDFRLDIKKVIIINVEINFYSKYLWQNSKKLLFMLLFTQKDEVLYF